jgi:iron complex outermembrane receptor protein
MRHLFQSAGVLALALASCAAIAGPAAAQSASAPAAKPDNANQVEELVVTATKREQNLRDIPATISAVTATQLQETGPVVGTGDLLRTVPGVRFNDLQAPNLSEISIRGSGTQRATGADSSVGLFVNGAYAGSSTLGGRNFKNIDFFDLERVEVLEGPQSALYGRNAEFGVVNVVLAKPRFDNSGFLDETYINKLQQNRLIGVVNHALGDDFAVRISAETVGQSKGFYINPVNNEYYDQTNGWIGRAQARYRKGPLDVDLLFDAQDMKLPAFVSGLAITPGTTAAVPLGFSNDRFSVPSEGINSTEQRVQRSQLLVDYDLGWANLNSVTMATYSSSQQYFGAAVDLPTEAQMQAQGEAGVYPFTQTHTGAEDRTYYEDLHLTGKTMEGKLNWLAGLELMDQRDTNLVQTATNPCTLTATSSICTGTPATPICIKLIPNAAACPAIFPLAFGAVNYTPQRYKSAAVYGSLAYTVDRLTLQGELRYTHDDKQATANTQALYTGVRTVKPTTYEFKASKPSYAATLSYKLPVPGDDMIYAKTGTGYRAGGVNGGTSTPLAPIPFLPTYNDEDTSSVEVGFKGDVGSHVFVTFDAYKSETKNAITNINDGCTVINVCHQAATVFNINGGTIHANGVELAIDSRFEVAGGPLTLSLSGANQHAKFVSVSGTFAGLPVVGSKVAQIPEWTSAATLDYRHRLTDDLDGFVHYAYHGQSGGGQDTVTVAIPFVPLASVSYSSIRFGVDYNKLEAAVFVQNLTDQTLRLLTLQAGGVTTAVRYNQPRTVGINLVYRW